MQKLQDQQLQQDTKDWENALKPLQSAFDSQLRGLLSGTETWAQAMKKIVGDLVIQFIEGAETMAVRWASIELAKTQATVAGVAARTTAEQAGSAAALGSQIATAVSAIAVDVGQIFANLAAWLTATFGPAGIPIALGLAAGAGALALSKMKSFEVGAWEIPSTSPAMLHAGEMVVPAGPAEAFRSAVAGGGGGNGGFSGVVNFNVSAMDAASIQKFFQQNGNQIARSLQSKSALMPSAGWA